jgi:hypothetical protein
MQKKISEKAEQRIMEMRKLGVLQKHGEKKVFDGND